MTNWNVIWKDEELKDERVMLANIPREEALRYVEQYFGAFEKKALHQWKLKNSEYDFVVKLEKV